MALILVSEPRQIVEDLFKVTPNFHLETLFDFIFVIKFSINSYPNAIINPVQKINPEVIESIPYI